MTELGTIANNKVNVSHFFEELMKPFPKWEKIMITTLCTMKVSLGYPIYQEHRQL